MAAEGIVSIVMGRLTDLLSEETQLLHRVKDEIELVVTELGRMKTILRDAGSRINQESFKTLVAQVRDLVYDAEDVVESFLLKASSRESRKLQGGIKSIDNRFALHDYTYHRVFKRDIKCIQTRMQNLFNCFGGYNFISTLEQGQESSSRLKRFHSFAVVEPELFVGFQAVVESLVRHLVNESDDCYPVIFIGGMGGLGKTTIAKKIYNHSTIKTHFSGLAWVSISQKWQPKAVLQRILISLDHEKKEEILKLEVDKLVENLLEIQQKKNCLIVLDDIWSNDAWDSLKAAFPNEISRSKLMLTSRIMDVASHVNPKCFVYEPHVLDAEQSWELLRLKALPKGDYLRTRDLKKMEQWGREMVRNCSGLPLAIVVLGGILVTKPTLDEWEKVYYDSLSSLKRGEGLGEGHREEVFDILIWSYNNLPPQLKPCFLHLGKYCEDAYIEAETLYQVWIAEGLILSSDKKEGETMIEVAESYLGELVHRSMVQVTFNDLASSLTKFKFCSLHDLLRDLSLSQAEVEDFFEVIDLREGNNVHLNVDSRFSYPRQLVVHCDEGCSIKNAKSYFVKKVSHQHYRSMLLLNKFATSLTRLLVSHVAQFKSLRVLSLEQVYIDKSTLSGLLVSINIGRVLGSLVYLRYLSVRQTSLLIFPSIQELVFLQTLKLDIIDYTYFPPWLSRNILGNLGHLRHLCLPRLISHRNNFKLRFDGLSKLETLENFDSSWCELKDLPKLISLQKLNLTVSCTYDEDEIVKYLLSSNSCLRYLSITIFLYNLGSEKGADMFRQLIWNQKLNLKELTLIGKVPVLAQIYWQQQPDITHIDVSLLRITKLELHNSDLEEDPMPVLEKIPTLRNLYLSSAYVGKKMLCSAMGFPKLTHLELRWLVYLIKWRVEEGSMPILKQLSISVCPKLRKLPEGMRFLNSLERLALDEMPSAFCDRVRVVNGEQGPDFYKVAHIPELEIDYSSNIFK